MEESYLIEATCHFHPPRPATKLCIASITQLCIASITQLRIASITQRGMMDDLDVEWIKTVCLTGALPETGA